MDGIMVAPGWNHSHTYPYRSIPPVECHIAPLYAIWNAGSKLTAKNAREIPAIAEEFCQYNGDRYDPQPERKENIEKRLAFVAAIWKTIEGAKVSAARWGKSAMKRKREPSPAKLDDAPSQTSRPSRRSRLSQGSRPSQGSKHAYVLVPPRPSSTSAVSSARATRSQNQTLNTPATESSKPPKLGKISSKGKGRSKGESGNSLDAVV